MIGAAALDLAVDVAAAYRLTRLVTVDTFPPVKALRDRIVDAHTTHGDNGAECPDSWAELITCPYCASFWIALGVVAARYIAPGPWAYAARVLAIAAVAGNVSAALDDD